MVAGAIGSFVGTPAEISLIRMTTGSCDACGFDVRKYFKGLIIVYTYNASFRLIICF